MHALIIEDEPLAVDLIEEALRRCGYTSFDIAFSAAEAVAAASKKCPDLITADQKLADGTGVEAVKQICADQAITVIFISGNAWSIRTLLPEAVILEKPFTLDQFESAVSEAVSHPFQSLSAA